ncbi:hypothetical protein EON65_25950 [archaeon]|nr:MAG: hypothetical protein EON65_25950 [archaeon]
MDLVLLIAKYLDRTFDNAFVGNALFWCTFCIVGQPMGVIMYYYDLTKLAMGAGMGGENVCIPGDGNVCTA